MENKKVLVFGVFDGCHEGHEYFLIEAKKLGDELIISVAQDSVIEKIKNRPPKYSMQQRISQIEKLNIADKIIEGSKKINTWDVLNSVKPNIIALGHDQQKLKEAIENIQAKHESIEKVIVIAPHNRDVFSSTNLLHS